MISTIEPPSGGVRILPNTQSHPTEDPSRAETRVNILLVDDIPAKMLALESVLSDLGQNIVKAYSGKEALRLLLNQDFAVILLDVNMPGLDGFETAELIRQRKRSEHIPIIFITGISTAEIHVSRGYSLGAVDYIFTPIVPEILKTKVGVFVDLCKKTEQVKRQAEELARSNRELEQFAYVASHDLQEPLRMIGSYTQLLAKRYQGKLDAQAEEYMGYTVSGVKRMYALIQDLLDFSRVGKQDQKLEVVDCETVLSSTLANLKATIAETKAVVTHDLLPRIIGNSRHLGQLFQNLIGNAIKFRGKDRPRIHVSATQKSDSWIFSIEDNGIGIEAGYWSRIFLIFQRLHSNSEYPGTGMGLAICKKIVEHQGGKIWLESEPGKGSTFYFSFPIINPSPLLLKNISPAASEASLHLNGAR